MAYNFAKRLKTLKGLTPYEYICKIWTNEPDRFNVNPFQHNAGLNTLAMDIVQKLAYTCSHSYWHITRSAFCHG
jgi:hypothetical protein